MGLEVGGKGDTKEKKKEEEKIPHMYESIGHQPLWGCFPKVISFVSTTALVVLVWSNTGLKWPFVNHLHYQWFLNEVCALFFYCYI